MKPIVVNWVPDLRLRNALYTVAGVLAILLIWQLFSVQSSYQALKADEQQRAERQKKESKLRLAAAPKVDERLAAEQARQRALLVADINPMFDAIERVQVAGVSLQRLEFDQEGKRIVLRYQLETVDKVVEVTERLNAGLGRPAWQLQQVSSSGGGRAEARPPFDAFTKSNFIAVWQSTP